MNYNDGKWHGWTGGECPVHPESEVSVMLFDGHVLNGHEADEWDWTIKKGTSIVAFCVTKVVEEPKEFWITLPAGFAFTNEESARDWAITARGSTIVHVKEVKE